MYTIYHVPGIKVGCSVDPKARVRAQKYTEYEILEICNTVEAASEREIYWQEKLGYGRDAATTYKHMMNVCKIAHTPEVIAKRAKSFKNNPTAVASSIKNLNLTRTPEMIARKVKKWKETIKVSQKFIETRKAMHKPEVIAKRKVPVIQYDIQGNFIKEWQGAIDVQKALGISHVDICSCCKGRQKTAKGFTWKYKNS
jgi:hypothetical protein